MESGTTTVVPPGIIVNKGSSELKLVIGKLSRGREIADELLSMFHDKSNGGGAAALPLILSGSNMVENILTSFADALSILQAANHHHHDSGEVISQLNHNKRPQQQEYSGESCKTPLPKDRRGTYKRRKTADTWTKETPNLFEDGHAWRKYGQKTILNTKHPRNYFRCTHKYDQQCQATKQVQKIQEDPAKYRTTYHGNHTCKKFTQSLPHDDQLHPIDDDHSSIIWSFRSPAPAIPQLDNTTTIAAYHKTTNSIMKEERAAISSSSVVQHSNSKVDHLQDDYFVSPNFDDHLATPFDTSSVPHLHAFSSGTSEHADVISSSDVYSCTTSMVDGGDSIDMDSMLDLSDFSEDHFHYI